MVDSSFHPYPKQGFLRAFCTGLLFCILASLSLPAQASGTVYLDGFIGVTFSTQRGEQDHWTGWLTTSTDPHANSGFTAVVKMRVSYYDASGAEINQYGYPKYASDPTREIEIFRSTGGGDQTYTMGSAFDGYYFVWYDNRPVNARTAVRSYQLYVTAGGYNGGSTEIHRLTATKTTNFVADGIPWP